MSDCPVPGCQHFPANVTELRPDNVVPFIKPRVRRLMTDARAAYEAGEVERGRDLGAEAVALLLRERSRRASR